MSYEYSGYLSTVLDKPDPDLLESADSITFGPEDLANWGTNDFDHALEWQNVPVTRPARKKASALKDVLRRY